MRWASRCRHRPRARRQGDRDVTYRHLAGVSALTDVCFALEAHAPSGGASDPKRKSLGLFVKKVVSFAGLPFRSG